MKQDKSVTPVPSGVSRRTVVKGAAWAVPAIAVASSVPAMAASGGPPEFAAGVACKLPGASCAPFVKGYIFPFLVTNNSAKTVYITAVSITSIVDTDLQFALANPPLPITIAPGASVPVYFNASSDNSANEVFTATVSITWGHVPDGTDLDHEPVVVEVQVDGTNPCKSCTPPVFETADI